MRLKYVTPERLPNGGTRYRFRRGKIKVTLRGEPGSREFHEHYASLVDGAPAATMPIAAPIKGSIRWLVGLYLADLERRVAANLASPGTLKGHAHHLGRLVAAYGDKDARMPRSEVIKLHDQYGATPGGADNLLKAISALYKWSIMRQYVDCANPARDVKRYRKRSEGFPPWTAADFEAFFDAHGPGTMARRTLVLAIYTTARRGDLCRLGRQNEVVIDGRRWLRWDQDKAPHETVELPMSEALIAELAGHGNMTYILNGYGAPFTHAGIGNRFKAWCTEAGLSNRSLHGVRKGLPNLLTAAGAPTPEIDVLLGHEMGSSQTKVYTRAAERARLAESVVARLEAVLR